MEQSYIIYKHTSPSGKSYIGQTKNFDRRLYEHLHKSSNCIAFRNAITKYGWENFTTEILLENLTLEEANQQEEFYIRTHNTMYPSGYNLKSGGEHNILSEFSKQKISDSLSGKPKPPRTEQHRKNIARAHTGVKRPPVSDDTRKKLSEARQGKTHSKETREKLSKANTGRASTRKGTITPTNVKQKISIANTGKKRTQEARQKMSAAQKGKKLSAETLQKRQATRLANKQKRILI